MIGQKTLQELFKLQVENHNLSRFIILQGPRGSEKLQLAKYISKLLHSYSTEIGIKIDDIRGMIDNSYRLKESTLYIITDADTMSVPAQNALLKVTEEPPNNAYFILLVEDVDSMLYTIRSRGTVFVLDNYSSIELKQYLVNTTDTSDADEVSIALAICETPGEIDILIDSGGILQFYEYVKKVFNNIGTVSGTNAFKIADKIKFKEDSEGCDLKLFWKAFCDVCLLKCYEDTDYIKYLDMSKITAYYLSQLRIRGINKQSLFDMWLLDVREVLI